MVEPDPLDREIDGLLDVGPSHDFVARVRANAGARSMASAAWLAGPWMAVAASLVAAVVMLSLWGARVAPPLPPRPIVAEFTALEPPAPIVIEPITIAPLLTADIALGEQQ